jgi:hypothetical protein
LRDAARLAGKRDDDVLERFKVSTDGGALLLPVELRRKTYLFILDTGSTFCCYDASLRLLLGDAIKLVEYGTPDRDITTPIYRSPAGKVGSLALPANSEAFCFDLEKIREAFGQECYGILGMDFLRQYVFSIDFDRGEVTFLRSVGADAGRRVPVIFQGNAPHVLIEAEGLTGQGRFLVDTGHVGLQSGDLQAEAFALLEKAGGLTLAGRIDFDSLVGPETARIGRLRAMSLAGFRHQKMMFLESRKNMLGLNYWSRYRVTFDFPHNALYLKKGTRFDRPDLEDRSGIDFVRRNGDILVKAVGDGSPAARAGLQAKDVILKFDDVDASERSLMGLRHTLAAAAGNTCRLRIRRADRELDINIRLPVR